MRRLWNSLRAPLLLGVVWLAGGLPAQELQPLVPELLGVIYYHDAEKNVLVPLERQPARQSTSGGSFLFGQYRRRITVAGDRSPVHVPQGQKLEFVISSGDVQLYALEPKKNRREVVISKTTYYGVTSRSKSRFAERMLDVKRYGSALKISPTEPLPPGEYGFYMGNAMYCFAITPAAAK